MKSRNLLLFLLQWITAGLAVAFLVLWLVPGLRGPATEIVEVRESAELAPHSAGANSGPVSYADAVARALPAVVNIHTSKVIATRSHPLMKDPVFRYFFGNQVPSTRKRVQNSLGSGVIFSTQGYVLTNNHVIDQADAIQVLLNDGRSTAARIIGTDPDTDLAVLKIDLDDLPSIVVGHSRSLRVGDVVLAIGNPFGVGQTVTQGIVSATGRDRLGINTFEDFIQTDAAINPGNSGGALINARGNLVGINTAIFSRSGGSQGIGFAIPVALARGVMEQIIEHGFVERGWLGIEAQDLTPALAKSFGTPDVRGLIISGIQENGPAAQAGILPGDIVTRIDDLEVRNTRDSMNYIADQRPGTLITIHGYRKGEPFSVDAEVSRRPRINHGADRG